jgi:hypothetical protein
MVGMAIFPLSERRREAPWTTFILGSSQGDYLSIDESV